MLFVFLKNILRWGNLVGEYRNMDKYFVGGWEYNNE